MIALNLLKDEKQKEEKTKNKEKQEKTKNKKQKEEKDNYFTKRDNFSISISGKST